MPKQQANSMDTPTLISIVVSICFVISEALSLVPPEIIPSNSITELLIVIVKAIAANYKKTESQPLLGSSPPAHI
jgi:hypothetical protein